MSTLSENLDAAKAATRYLSQLKVRSNNRPHELAKWILKHPRSLVRKTDVKQADGSVRPVRGVGGAQKQFGDGVDGFLLSLLRHENNDANLRLKGMGDSERLKVRGRRKQIVQILVGNGSARQKRDAVKAQMRFWEGQDGGPWWTWCRGEANWHGGKSKTTGATTEWQTQSKRAEKKLRKMRYGNCGEKSAAVYEYLIRNNTSRQRHVLWISCSNWDHAFTVYGADHAAGGNVASWGRDAVIVDGWSEDYYVARDPHAFAKGNFPGPWQLWVRNQIKKNANALTITQFHDGAGAPPPPPTDDDAEEHDVSEALASELEDEEYIDPFLVTDFGDEIITYTARVVVAEVRGRSGTF